jgi:hypothetical protein
LLGLHWPFKWVDEEWKFNIFRAGESALHIFVWGEREKNLDHDLVLQFIEHKSPARENASERASHLVGA